MQKNVEKKASKANYLLLVRMVLYMIVGTQMAYLMAPFVGSDDTFILFRGPDSNFFMHLAEIVFKR